MVDSLTVHEAIPAINVIKIIDQAKHLSTAEWRTVGHLNAPQPLCPRKRVLIKAYLPDAFHSRQVNTQRPQQTEDGRPHLWHIKQATT